MGKITGNQLLVKALKEEGVDTVFGYPGACVIDIFDELYKDDTIDVILPRHEQGLVSRQTGMQGLPVKWGSVLRPAGRGRQTW